MNDNEVLSEMRDLAAELLRITEQLAERDAKTERLTKEQNNE